MSVPLPLYLSLEDVQDPTGFTMRALWNAWRIDMEGIDQRTEAYKEVVDFAAKLDQYDTTYNQHLPPDKLLFQAHLAQAFRESRMLLILSTPDLLPNNSKTGSSHTKREVLSLIDWCQSRKRRTFRDAVQSASSEKDLGNELAGKQEYGEAIWHYILGLAMLTPWSSDATIMTFDQAGEMGLRQIEQALLKNIAVTAHKAAGAEKKVNKSFVTIFAAALTSLEHHPFETWDSLVKRHQLQRESIEKFRSCWSHTAISAFQRREKMIPAWKEMPGEEWAHAGCGEGHRCYAMAHMEKKGSARKNS